MPFTYPAVSIGSAPYDVYADVEDADGYIDASMSSAADTWRDSTLTDATTKARALVSATRWLDSVNWTGEKADASQELAWPRTGITGVASDELPPQLVSACAELAMALADNSDARAELSDPGTKSLKAGSVAIDYFRPEGNTQVQTPFPAVVMALISQWLGGSVVIGGAVSYGTECKSKLLDEQYDFTHGQ